MKILAVEDEPEYLEMLQDVLRSVGHDITIARNGVEGLAILGGEHVDVILSDVTMPLMDGLEFHRRVRAMEAHSETPFIFLTGVTDIGAVTAECRIDRDLVLQKPFPVDHLMRIFAGKV